MPIVNNANDDNEINLIYSETFTKKFLFHFGGNIKFNASGNPINIYIRFKNTLNDKIFQIGSFNINSNNSTSYNIDFPIPPPNNNDGFDKVMIYTDDENALVTINNVVINEPDDDDINIIYRQKFNKNFLFNYGGNIKFDGYGNEVNVMVKFENDTNRNTFQIGPIDINSLKTTYDIDFPIPQPKNSQGFDSILIYSFDESPITIENVIIDETFDPNINIVYNQKLNKNHLFEFGGNISFDTSTSINQDIFIRFLSSKSRNTLQVGPINLNPSETSYNLEFPMPQPKNPNGFDSIIIYSLDFTSLDIHNVVINETIDPSINVIYNETFNKNLLFRFGGNVLFDAYGDHVDIILKFSNTNNNEIYQIGPVNINSINLKSYDINFPPSSPEVIEGFNSLMIYSSDDSNPIHIENVNVKESIDPSINIIYNEIFSKNLLFRFGGVIKFDGVGDQVDVMVKFVNSNNDDIYQVGPININSTEFTSYNYRIKTCVHFWRLWWELKII